MKGSCTSPETLKTDDPAADISGSVDEPPDHSHPKVTAHGTSSLAATAADSRVMDSSNMSN